MTKTKEAGLDPEKIFNEGTIAGQSGLHEQLGGRLQAELGLSPGEVEALFDPAPRRGRGRKASRKYDPAPRRGHKARRYDPAPSRARQYVAKAKAGKILNKIMPYIPVGVGLVTFVSLYQTRADELKAAGKLNKDGTPVAGVVDAFMYDINNFSANGGMSSASDRLMASWKEILGGVGGGLAVKELSKNTKYAKYGSLAGKSLVAIGAAYAGKAFFDPPINNTGMPVRQMVQQEQIQTRYIPAPQMQQDNRVRGTPQTMTANQTHFVNPY